MGGWWMERQEAGVCLGQRGVRHPLGREEVIAAGLCLAMTLTGSDCVGPLEGLSLKEQRTR